MCSLGNDQKPQIWPVLLSQSDAKRRKINKPWPKSNQFRRCMVRIHQRVKFQAIPSIHSPVMPGNHKFDPFHKVKVTSIKRRKTNRPWPKSNQFWRWSGYISMQNFRLFPPSSDLNLTPLAAFLCFCRAAPGGGGYSLCDGWYICAAVLTPLFSLWQGRARSFWGTFSHPPTAKLSFGVQKLPIFTKIDLFGRKFNFFLDLFGSNFQRPAAHPHQFSGRVPPPPPPPPGELRSAKNV